MRVTMEQNIDLLRRAIRWNVHEAETPTVASQVDRQWPVGILIAIAPHEGDRRPEIFETNE